MNKDEMVTKMNALLKKCTILQKNNDFLMNQQKQFKIHAEQAGSNSAKWEYKALRLEQENNSLKSQVELLQVKKK